MGTILFYLNILTVFNILVASVSVCILRSEQVLVYKKEQNIYFLVKSCQSGKLSLPQPSLYHGTLLPDQAGGEHQLHHLHRLQVAS